MTMTDLQKLYMQATVVHGKKHAAALRFIERETGLDTSTINRSLARAKREDDRHSKRKRPRK